MFPQKFNDVIPSTPRPPTVQDLWDAMELVADFRIFCDNDGFQRLQNMELEFDPYDWDELERFVDDSPFVCEIFLKEMYQHRNRRKEIPNVIDLS